MRPALGAWTSISTTPPVSARSTSRLASTIRIRACRDARARIAGSACDTVEDFQRYRFWEWLQQMVKGKRVLVLEDGPTLTHGEMKIGAGVVAANKYGASELVDPRPYTVRSITETYKKYPGIGMLLPAMGYGTEQVKDLETTINRVPCDVVVIGTPIDLNRIVKIRKPTVRVTYQLQEIGTPNLEQVVGAFVKKFVKR